MKIISNLKLFILFTLILGFAYPLMVFWVGSVAFKDKANGSLVYRNHEVIGSKLIGQNFTKNIFFQGRPSASSYDGLASGGTNSAPTSKSLKERIDLRKAAGFEEEMLFSSASGLDPHISLKSAILQVEKIVKSRKLDLKSKEKLISYLNSEAGKEEDQMFEKQKLNVLNLNLYLENEFN